MLVIEPITAGQFQRMQIAATPEMSELSDNEIALRKGPEMYSQTVAASIMLTTCLLAGTAAAGGCPAEHVLTEPRQIERVPQVALTRDVIANVRLEGWRDMGAFILRTRRLELQPGGTVPTHSHANRPAIVYVLKGTVTEHNSFCAVPIVHHAGDVSEEFGPGFVHYWENTGTETVTFLSSDVVPYPSDAELVYGFEANSSPEDSRRSGRAE